MNRRIIHSNENSFEEDVVKSHIPTAVFFYSEDCAPCTAFSPIFERMAEAYSESIRFVKINQPENQHLLEKLSVRSIPSLLFFQNGKEACSRLCGYISAPDFRDVLENVLGGRCPKTPGGRLTCDVLIIGAGPAGLTSAIYTSRSKLLTVVLDEGLAGGQVLTTYHVANYPGTKGVVKGIDLMEDIKNQALGFGARIDDMKDVLSVDFKGEIKHVKARETDYFAKSIIIATGAQPRKLPAEGEQEYRGRGVHYCATCDGALYQGTDVIVVGGGNSAVEEAVTLAGYARKVTIVHRYDYFEASKTAQDEALKNPKISIVWNSQVKKIHGNEFVTGVVIENVKTGKTDEIKVDGVFVYIGMEPRSSLFKDKLDINDYGYITTDDDLRTNIPGIFAAGDVRDKKVRQIANAVGDGAVAGVMAERYIAGT